MEIENNFNVDGKLEINSNIYWGVQPHFCPWKNVCFPIFFPWGKMGKKVYGKRGK